MPYEGLFINRFGYGANNVIDVNEIFYLLHNNFYSPEIILQFSKSLVRLNLQISIVQSEASCMNSLNRAFSFLYSLGADGYLNSTFDGVSRVVKS